MTESSSSPIQYFATDGGPHFEPYRHQTAAWNELDKHFVRKGAKAGIVVVPTGGGKTAIAVHCLSHAELARACEQAAKDALLTDTTALTTDNLVAALNERRAMRP
jgi:ATP-dependent helicase YprA (DUF1998 family)